MTRVPTMEDRLAARHKPSQWPVMFQTWSDLLFLHWESDPAEVQKTLPPGLSVDTFAGRAFLGIIPFFVKNVRPSFLPPFPGISEFLELNVRTYVYDNSGTPGVWFYSLDCSQALAVWGARQFFCLPYVQAEMKAAVESGTINFKSCRQDADGDRRTEFRYAPATPLAEAQPETIEFFLIERYYLFSYSSSEKVLYRAQVHHRPYPLAEARLNHYDSVMLELNGFPRESRAPDHIILSSGVDVSVYSLERSPSYSR